MKRWIVLCFGILVLSSMSMAQKYVPSIVVVGESKILQMPDMMEVNVTISTLDKEYRTSIEKNLKGVDQLKGELKKANVPSLVVKDLAQRVNEEKSYSGGKSVIVGYRANYKMVLELNTQPDQIHKVLKVLRQSGVEMNYNASYRLTPQLLKDTKKELIEKAVADAMNKANIIAGASNSALERIMKIQYGAVNYRPGPVLYRDESNLMSMKAGVGHESFTQPDAIELTDRVEIAWQLK